ncbi:MAG: U32 family peptidase [Clostridia bacterium]|nr:U32 family peptidase [Clostridia bacterium]
MKPELLAPAGDMESLDAALRFGADAVYVGGPMLQLRSASAGFALDDLARAVSLAHAQGKKLYITVNCFAKDSEFTDICLYVHQLKEIGVDAVIVSDLGAIACIRQAEPHLAVHVSTQANCRNARAAEVYASLGVKRIVLSREMTLEEIRVFSSRIPPELEIEAFVHGAMCMAYSGRCLISSFLANRSGNRGECAQPCRWQYQLMEEKRPGEYFPIEEAPEGTTILSSCDLNCLSFLDELKRAGVTSFKIEGRMKSAYYVATVVNTYRRAIDQSAPIELLEEELKAVSHRPYSTGFYYGDPRQSTKKEAYIREKAFAAVVKDEQNGRVTVEQRTRFFEGDVLEVLSPSSFGLSFAVQNLRNEAGEPVSCAPHATEILTIDCPFPLKKGDILRRRS